MVASQWHPLISRQSSFFFPINFFSWHDHHATLPALLCHVHFNPQRANGRKEKGEPPSSLLLSSSNRDWSSFFQYNLLPFYSQHFSPRFRSLLSFVHLWLLCCTKTQTYPVSCDFMSERKEMADYLIHVVNKYWWGSSRKWFVLNAGRLCWGVGWSLGLWSSGLVRQELPGTFLVPTCLAI